MSIDENALREANIARAKAMFTSFHPKDPAWVAGLHADVVMEFPFGRAIGLPAEIPGKDQCAGLFQVVSEKLGLVFYDIEVAGMADPGRVLVTCKGRGEFGGKSYNQTYITLLEFRDEQLVLYREYMDTQVVADVLGHLSALV